MAYKPFRLMILLAMGAMGVGACGGTNADLSSGAPDDSTTTRPATSSTVASESGLDCEPAEREVGAQGTYAGDPEVGVILEEPAPKTPEDAVEQYRQQRFPGMSERAERSGDREFTVQKASGERVMVFVVEKASNGWYVPGYRACEGFEQRARGESELEGPPAA